VHCEKTQSLRTNEEGDRSFKMNENGIEEVKKLSFTDSVVTSNGGAGEGENIRSQRENSAFIQACPLWKAGEIPVARKSKTFRAKSSLFFFMGAKRGRLQTE
jgi:hypothetical protein